MIPLGLCQCGCGGATTVSRWSNTAQGYVKGRPRDFLPGHSTRLRKPRRSDFHLHNQGYHKVYDENRGKWVFEHRKIMEDHLGRRLGADEIVHHVNEDRADNRLENLRIVDRAWHQRHHVATRPDIDDDAILQLLRRGWTYAQFAAEGIWQRRVARVKRQNGLLRGQV